jgi:hypothetical protein
MVPMSKYTLLYYPGFHPDPIWARKVLLLADELARIVPRDVNLCDPDGLRTLQDAVAGRLPTIVPEP